MKELASRSSLWSKSGAGIRDENIYGRRNSILHYWPSENVPRRAWFIIRRDKPHSLFVEPNAEAIKKKPERADVM